MIIYSPEADDTMQSAEDNQMTETFLQRDNCFNTSRLLPQCYECEKDPETNRYSCRFNEFRKIERRSNGALNVVGFLDPHIDPRLDDLELWNVPEKEVKVDRETADYILSFTASQFCEMSEIEMKISKNQSNIAWKRSVVLVREICDVCDTSVFNIHWTCVHCGTCICIDCFKERKDRISRWKPLTKVDKEERDNFFWIKCLHPLGHELLMTQMTTGDSLMVLNTTLHDICEQRNITQKCGCSLKTNSCIMMQAKNLLLESHEKKPTQSELRQIMKRQRHKAKKAVTRRFTLFEQQEMYKNVKHMFISKGRILKILEPSESVDCYKIFQDQWEKGKPVLVANVTRNLRKFIWTPEYFSSRFGNERHMMVNCENNVSISRVAMKYFWDGFSSIKKRLPRDCDDKVVLKLKDWPTSDDFADAMKEHFDDIMKAMPLAAYTRRDGKFNLARYLPAHFSRPDLGPKMYSAYSQVHPAKKGSTNLHLDVSDAINVMLHVSKPTDAHLAPSQYSIEAIRHALVEAGADEADKEALINGNKLPGAIWHIFPAHQSDDLRKVLHSVAKESGKPLGVNDDPIHDQVRFYFGSAKIKNYFRILSGLVH